MVKIESSVPGVYLVGPAGKERPWCGKCHKFLKSETAAHDCTPAHLSGGRKAVPGARRRIRLTPKTKSCLDKVFRSAAKEAVLSPALTKLAASSTDKAILSAAKKLRRKMKDAASSGAKKYAKLVKRFL